MSTFFWSSGHLGWLFFALLVFTASWLLFADLLWRFRERMMTRFVAEMLVAWLAGLVLIVLCFHAAGH